ncbi:hypothetical protein N9L68_04250 [bacterium]|nr:hypothetical protein [bacterium]
MRRGREARPRDTPTGPPHGQTDWKRQRTSASPRATTSKSPSSGRRAASGKHQDAPWDQPKRKVTLTPPTKAPSAPRPPWKRSPTASPSRSGSARSRSPRRTPSATRKSPTVKATNLQSPPPKAPTYEQKEKEIRGRAQAVLRAAQMGRDARGQASDVDPSPNTPTVPRTEGDNPQSEPEKVESSTEDEDT